MIVQSDTPGRNDEIRNKRTQAVEEPVKVTFQQRP